MKLVGKVVGGFILLVVGGIAAVFYFTSGLVDEADRFFAEVRAGNQSAAYEMLSAEFKKATNQDQLNAFLQASGLNNTTDVSWSNRSIDGSQGALKGIANLSDGSTFPLEVSFVSEGSQWKILGIHKTKGGVSESQNLNDSDTVNSTASHTLAANTLSLPGEPVQITLVQGAMNAFGESVNEKDMSKFHSYISQLWQSQFNIEKLDEAYKGLYEMDGDLTKVSKLPPVFSEPAKLTDQGVMQISGFFPTKPKQVNFEQQFVREGTQWKLLGFNIRITG
ncbi:MAG: hypothetical protein KDD70_10200 [Bdellovibrionales bacterium]|nr:hypothetical protein [Bdellovibrionales bacterium]